MVLQPIKHKKKESHNKDLLVWPVHLASKAAILHLNNLKSNQQVYIQLNNIKIVYQTLQGIRMTIQHENNIWKSKLMHKNK